MLSQQGIILAHKRVHAFFYKKHFGPRQGSVFLKIQMIHRSKSFLRVSYFCKNGGKWFKIAEKCPKKRKMFLRFQRIALDVSYDFGRNRSMFLMVVFLIKKRVINDLRNMNEFKVLRGHPQRDTAKLGVGIGFLGFLWTFQDFYTVCPSACVCKFTKGHRKYYRQLAARRKFS